MKEEPADVVIVGAGAAAGVAALRLVQGGLTVTCLEQGEWHHRSEYRGAMSDWELTSRKQWSGDPNVRALPEDYPVDVSESDLGVRMFNGVGGGTVLYNAVWPRLKPSDFRVATLDGVADDWPLGYDDLLPYYEATDRQFGVSGLGGNPAYPSGAEPPFPPLPIGRGGLKVARSHARLGWNWWPDSNAILSIPSDGRHPCVQRGTCGQGCGEGAKGSTDLTHWPEFVNRGGRLITGARATRVETDGKGLASGVQWVDKEGSFHFEPASTVLLAANGIGSPRLLLASDTTTYPDGLANSSGLVGRRLMLHPFVTVSGTFDEPLESWQGHNGSSIGCWEFYDSDPARGFARGSKWSLHPTGGPLRLAVPPGGKGVWGSGHHTYMRQRFGRTLSWILLCEDLPEEKNRVELSSETDTSGLPVPKINYRFGENVRRMMEWQGDRAEESLVESGAVLVERAITRSNAHLLGTARMGDDPASSVVDRWCMTHDIPNLGIIDGSVFVTAGAVNPTSTIVALALRAADHLVRRGGPPRRNRTTDRHSGPPPPVASLTTRVTDTRELALISDAQRQSFESLAGVLIPGERDRPSPAEVGVGGSPLDDVLKARPDLLNDLVRVLTGERVNPQEFVLELEIADQPGFEALTLAVAAAYYSDPAVRGVIGYPGQEARIIRSLTFPEYVAEGLLDHMMSDTNGSSGSS
jgi:choline dehydrogenase-like flavoprotein